MNLNLESGSSGDYKLCKHNYNAGTKFTLIPENHFSLLAGYKPKEIIIENNYVYYDLFFKNQRIMSSSPDILFTQYIPYVRAKGNILLGGFGLGILAKMLCMKNNVNRVTAVEFSGDIINLCRFNHEKLELIEADFYSFIKDNDLSVYDYIYIDTFTTINEVIYPEIIIPLKNFLLENYPTIPFDFWQEDEFKAKFLINSFSEANL